MEPTEAIKIIEKAITLVEPIPEENWVVGDFTDGKGRCCVVGHYTRLTSQNPSDFSEIIILRKICILEKENQNADS